MGWGMLTGLGKGLSGYAEIMGEKRKESFQLKKEELAFERNKALKDLEFQNQNKRDEKQRGWQEEDIELKRKYQLEDRDWETQDPSELYFSRMQALLF
jgi:hypothetical protein